MAVAADEWLDLIEREYLSDFISAGGGAIKFAVGDEDELPAVGEVLRQLSAKYGLAHVAVDAAMTKIHMIQDVFFAVARALDWDSMAQYFVEALFDRQGYAWPRSGEAVPIKEVAAHNRVDEILMRRDFRQWLTAELMRDAEMTQDFRVAMARLCLGRLEPENTQPGVLAPVLEWLRGDLRGIGALRETMITARITRHTGRAMLRSVCRWLRRCGRRGLCVVLDIRQLGRTGAAVGAGFRYTPVAVIDAFEVLRQLIDDAEHFLGLLTVVLADEVLIGDDEKRALRAYQALNMRIGNDVRPEGRDNPLAPLVRLAGRPSAAAISATVAA
jgi:hypothetical protein